MCFVFRVVFVSFCVVFLLVFLLLLAQELTTNREKFAKKNGPLLRKVCLFDVSQAVRIARFESVSELN